MSSYPRSLQYFLSRLSGWTSNQVRLQVAGSTTAQAGSIIEINIPSNTLVDLTSLAVHFDLVVASAGGHNVYVPRYMPQTMYRRVEWAINGITMSQSSISYGLVWDTLATATTPSDFQEFNMLNMGGKPSYSAPTANADHALQPFPTYTSCNFIGFGAMKTWLNSSLVGSCRVRLTLNSNDILGQSGGTDATYELRNLYATVTVASLSDGLYNAALQEKLARQEVLQMPFKSYFVFEQGNGSGGVASLKATLSSSSVDRLYGVTRAHNYTDKTVATQQSCLAGGTTPYFQQCGGGRHFVAAANRPLQGLDAGFNTADLTHYQFMINSVVCPNYQVSCGSAWTGAGPTAPTVRHGGNAALELRRSVGSLGDVDSGDGILFCQYAQFPYNTVGADGPCNVAGGGEAAESGAAQGGGNGGAAPMAGQNMMQHIYKNYHCIVSYATEYVGAESRTISGLNMRGSTGSLYFNATYSPNPCNQVLIIECTSILALSANGAAELII